MYRRVGVSRAVWRAALTDLCEFPLQALRASQSLVVPHVIRAKAHPRLKLTLFSLYFSACI